MNAALLTAPAAAPPTMLRVSGLTVGFGPVRALTDVSLTIDTGELVALAGEPGAGKTTLVRCLAGDLAPANGEIELAGWPVPADPRAASRRGISIVWQDLALCDNLDVAGNLLLGQETQRLMRSETRFHAAAGALLESLQIPIRDTRRVVRSLSSGQRRLIAIARAISHRPQLLVLDEPTESLAAIEARQVEDLIANLRAQGTTILLVSRDADQMFRMADRIIVLRHGSAVAELEPANTHPDDLAALQSGQEVDSSARRQLTRLHGLADSLVSADPQSSLSLILSALGAALGTERVCIHVVQDRALVCEASLGFLPGQISEWSHLALGGSGGAIGRSAALGAQVIEESLRSGDGTDPLATLAETTAVVSSWSVPVMGSQGVSAVITAFMGEARGPHRDELDLLTLYAGYAASAVERDRLLDQVTARNRVLETIREMLETLAGPVTVAQGLPIALQSLRHGLRANEVALLTGGGWRAYAGSTGDDPEVMSGALRDAARRALTGTRRDGSAQEVEVEARTRILAVPFTGPGGATVLLATWDGGGVTREETALIEDAAHSLRLALEREEAFLAHQEATALRRSRELQRGFLSRLSHELRTPLTAIRGYASSLRAPDVTWDGPSEARFLDRIAAESARLGRLVDDLLDFSAIESGVMRLQRDWCDIRLVVEAAVSCLPAEAGGRVTVDCDPAMPTVWADHDRLEQVFVNLLTNAFRHNPPGTRVTVSARELTGGDAAEVMLTVADDGPGFPAELAQTPFDSARRHRSPSAGAGLGLSIARGIMEAHSGSIALAAAKTGTTFAVRLPVEAVAPHESVSELPVLVDARAHG
jgi:signal transduction histidine kinase/ABC-type multidrug transport system ATPase subunit